MVPTHLARHRYLCSIVCCFGLVLISSLSAQTSPGRAKTALNEIQPFDPSVSILPVSYRGNDLKSVIKSLMPAAQHLSKNEFETRAEHEQRVTHSPPVKVANSVTTDSMLAFGITPRSFDVTYDAEQGLFTFTIGLLDGYGKSRYPEKGNVMFVISEVERVRRNYTASNAFGATRGVDYRDLDNYGVTLDLDDFWLPVDLQTLAHDPHISLDLNMSRERAKIVKDQLRLLAVCKLKAPFVLDVSAHHVPTLDNPRELNLTYYSLEVSNLQVWVYNFATGEIYLKYDRRIDVSK